MHSLGIVVPVSAAVRPIQVVTVMRLIILPVYKYYNPVSFQTSMKLARAYTDRGFCPGILTGANPCAHFAELVQFSSSLFVVLSLNS